MAFDLTAAQADESLFPCYHVRTPQSLSLWCVRVFLQPSRSKIAGTSVKISPIVRYEYVSGARRDSRFFFELFRLLF